MSAPDIDEINKIRKSIGLPLLPSASAPPATEQDGPKFKDASDSDDSDAEPASTLDTREAEGYGNFQKLQEDKRRQLERQRKKEAIQKARDQAARFSKLSGKGLGDADDNDDLDAKSWLKGSKKRQAEIAKQRAEQTAKELAEREEHARIQYTSKDLAGVKVAHEVGDFEDGENEQILTLQDAEIGDASASDDEDVLEIAEMVAKDKLKEKLDHKKKKTAYDVHDDNEGGLLGQYDEKKRKAFTLDERGSSLQERESKRQAIGDKLKNIVSLDILKPDAVSDYMEIKIKKPKKSKKKSTRKREQDEDDLFPAQDASNDVMDIDVARAPFVSAKATQSALNDDDDLANALSFSRRAALKKQKRKPEDIAKQLLEDAEEEAAQQAEEAGLTLDETTNFLDNLSSRPRSQSPKARIRKRTEEPDAADSDEDGDKPMAETSITDDTNEAEILAKAQQTSTSQTVASTGLDDEEDIEEGIGAALNLLRKRGGLDAQPNSTNVDRNKLLVDRQKFITEARLREHSNEQGARAQRERDRNSGRMANMSAKEREEHARWQNSQREHQSSIAAAAAFNRDYKPDVQLKYVDDDGRVMNQKDAFKHLSHAFHGKGSGKGKTEKMLKKREMEKGAMAKGLLTNSGASTPGVAQAMGRQRGEAGVRLG